MRVVGLACAMALGVGGEPSPVLDLSLGSGVGNLARLLLDVEQVLVALEDVFGPVEHVARDILPRGVVQIHCKGGVRTIVSVCDRMP